MNPLKNIYFKFSGVAIFRDVSDYFQRIALTTISSTTQRGYFSRAICQYFHQNLPRDLTTLNIKQMPSKTDGVVLTFEPDTQGESGEPCHEAESIVT